ncbi:MAG: hypothetical protein WBG36_06505 [Ornithinimicrobium sp.]
MPTASAMTSDPTANTANPNPNIRRRPKTSLTCPPAAIVVAADSRYAFDPPCDVGGRHRQVDRNGSDRSVDRCGVEPHHEQGSADGEEHRSWPHSRLRLELFDFFF